MQSRCRQHWPARLPGSSVPPPWPLLCAQQPLQLLCKTPCQLRRPVTPAIMRPPAFKERVSKSRLCWLADSAHQPSMNDVPIFTGNFIHLYIVGAAPAVQDISWGDHSIQTAHGQSIGHLGLLLSAISGLECSERQHSTSPALCRSCQSARNS